MNSSSPQEDSKDPADELPAVVQKVDHQQLRQFVTTIKTAEAQVGEHIIHALQHDGTVAVLTTVVMGPDGQQRIVSAALDPELMHEVQDLLARAQIEREEEEPCFGFHCLIKPKSSPEAQEDPNDASGTTKDGSGE